MKRWWVYIRADMKGVYTTASARHLTQHKTLQQDALATPVPRLHYHSTVIIMRGLVLLLVVSAALAVPQAPQPSATPESRACNDLLKSVEERVANKPAVEKCIAEQPGLQATLEKLKASSKASGPHSSFPTILLAEAGLTAEALALRKCISRENEQVITTANGSLVFDVTKLKSELAAKVAGTSSEANTKLGLDKCPVALLDNFEVFKYMGCIKIYCATGVAPKN